jgi:alkyl hydroperoxide reductase subunit AhpC
MVRRFLGVLFSHPADFTPVCTTELGTVANYYPEFVKRNASDCVKCRWIRVAHGVDQRHWRSSKCYYSTPIIADDEIKRWLICMIWFIQMQMKP